jgi:hypothetical protein
MYDPLFCDVRFVPLVRPYDANCDANHKNIFQYIPYVRIVPLKMSDP